MVTRKYKILPERSYLSFCNVSHICNVRAIPTIRVYQLYDTIVWHVNNNVEMWASILNNKIWTQKGYKINRKEYYKWLCASVDIAYVYPFQYYQWIGLQC